MSRLITNLLPARLALLIACALTTVEAQNYLKMDPPPDADKPFPVPAGDNSCWMATAANMLAGAGYGNGATVQARTDDIYADLIAQYGVANGGWADTAITWWLGSPNNIWPANPYTVVNVYGNKFRVPYAVATIPQDIGNQLRACNLVGLSLSWPDCSSTTGYGGHAITDWGDNVASASPLGANPTQVIVADSDQDPGGNNFTSYTYDAYAAPNPGGCNNGNGWYFSYSAAGFHPFIKHYVVLSPTVTPSGGTATYTAGGSTKLTNTSSQSATDLHYDALMWDDDCHHGYEVLTYRTSIDWNTSNSPQITEQYCDNGKLNGISVDWDLSDNPVPPGKAVTVYTELILNAGNFLVYSSVHFTYPEGNPLVLPGLAWHLLTPRNIDPQVPHITGGYVIGLIRYASFDGAILEARLQHQYAFDENPEQHTVSLTPGDQSPIMITEMAFGHSYGLLSLTELQNFGDWMTRSEDQFVVQPNEPYEVALDWTGRLPYPIGDDPIPVVGPAVVSIERVTPSTVRVSWSGPFNLYEAPELTGRWTQTASQENPQVVEATASKRFYRTQDPSGQVHSVNVVSYINVPVKSGFQIICNPLNGLTPRDNWIDPHIPPILAEGTTVYKYNPPQGYQGNVYEFGEWTDPEMPLPPGVGFWVQLPAGPGTYDLLFAGECLQGPETNLPLVPGFQLIASTVCQAGKLQTDLGFPVLEGDVIYKFDAATQSYQGFSYDFGEWGPSEPMIGPDEGFWVLTSTPRTWVRDYVIP